MPKLTNISPLGALDVPLLRAVLEPGQTVEVTEDQARTLLLQPGNYAPADKAAKTLAASLPDRQDPGQPDTRPGADNHAQAAPEAAATEGETR